MKQLVRELTIQTQALERALEVMSKMYPTRLRAYIPAYIPPYEPHLVGGWGTSCGMSMSAV